MHYPKVLERVDFPEQIFHRSFSLGAPDTFKYRAELVQAFTFQPVRHESGIFGFECIKACLRHDLSRHVESARRNMKWKLASKFPTPYE